MQQLTEALEAWKIHVDGLSGDADTVKELTTAYFDQIHADFIKLRDYISAYTFAIPAKLFSGYQNKFATFTDQYQERKDEALPKKKFTLKRRAKKATKETVEESKKEEKAVVQGPSQE